MSSRTNWIEIVRRVLACLCLAAALVTFLTPAPALVNVAPEDFVARQKRELFADDRRLPLADYIAKETKERLVSVQGAEWQTLFQAVNATTSGQPPNVTWKERLIQNRFTANSVFFRLDEAPLNRVTGGLNDSYSFTYLALADSTPTRYLGVTYLRPFEMLDSAPPSLAYPWRPFTLWLALLALAIYVLLPRAKHPPEALTYSRLRAVLLPDLLGFFLFGVFFALPLLVIPHASSDANLFDVEGGWIFLTLCGWLFALFGIVLLAIATWYAAYEILVLADRLRVTDLFSQRECLYRDMARVSIYTLNPPRWLMVGGLIVSFFNWRALAPTLIASRAAHGIEIARKEGRPLRILVNALPGTERLLQAFRQQGVSLTPEVEALLELGEE
jgi:hypothetical protein